jgi:hypothetical protein
MNRVAYIVLTISLMNSCQPNNGGLGHNRLSRIERIEALPHRNLQLTPNQQNTINDYIQEVLNRTKSLAQLKLYYATDNGKIVEMRKRWESANQLIKTSYEVWREIDILMTIAVYPAFSTDATTGDQRTFYIVEVEHRDLTGTCRMIFDNPQEETLTTLSYTDRN